MNRFLIILSAILLIGCQSSVKYRIEFEGQSDPRITFGIEKFKKALSEGGYKLTTDAGFPIKIQLSENGIAESFAINSSQDQLLISGADASGVLYGCLELSDIVLQKGRIPKFIKLKQAPEMVLRGTCIGLQKTEYLPERSVYEYPYTPENFPWFYDKALWVKYLDILAENRYNTLYLWNGHPFASLVKLEDYPYALEVDEETYRRNEEIFTFLTTEAEKRGIWVIQMFYNIILPKPLAEKQGIKTQDRSRPILPIAEDYTRKAIAAFVKKYPNVGLLVALGEAMQGIENDVDWFTNTIIPGVQDGLAALGKTNEPPIVLRGHDTDAAIVMENALPLYKNLYTLNKYNGESLTTYEPKGKWAAYHKSLGDLGSTHIDNVHILANLEPFRYASPDFIQKSVKAMKSEHGANGLHLFPQTSYWEWPYSPDKTDPLLLEMDRDWAWYKAWGRYAWKSDRNRDREIEYWTDQFNEYFGCEDCGEHILEAYEAAGEISPMILRRYGITEGNRQTMTLGMFMSQLVSPEKFSLNKMLNESHGPQGEWLSEYARKEFNGEPHKGETPLWAASKILEYADEAVAAVESVNGSIEKREEFERWKNDIYCYEAMARFYSAKAKAALKVLNFGYTHEITLLDQAIELLAESVNHFQRLTELTTDTYRYANSMQTKQRRIPIGGNEGKNKHWEELLPYYETELDNFRRNVRLLKTTKVQSLNAQVQPLTAVEVEFTGKHEGNYELKAGEKPFTESEYEIKNVAPELANLSGVKYSFEALDDFDTEVKFKTDVPVKMVVGFFQSDKTEFLSPPTLEYDASANFYGQADIKILNALEISGLPPVNVHTYYFEQGEHSLLFDNDVFLILGFIDGNVEIKPRDAGLGKTDVATGLDWLFY